MRYSRFFSLNFNLLKWCWGVLLNGGSWNLLIYGYICILSLNNFCPFKLSIYMNNLNILIYFIFLYVDLINFLNLVSKIRLSSPKHLQNIFNITLRDVHEVIKFIKIYKFWPKRTFWHQLTKNIYLFFILKVEIIHERFQISV